MPEATLGETSYVKKVMLIRSCVGHGGIAFAFLGIENLPLGDATVLVMLSPLFASMFSYMILGESFGKGEIMAILISLTGVVLISRPSFIFGGEEALIASRSSVCIGGLCMRWGSVYFIRILGTVAKMPWANVFGAICRADHTLFTIFYTLPSAFAVDHPYSHAMARYPCGVPWCREPNCDDRRHAKREKRHSYWYAYERCILWLYMASMFH